MTLTMEELVAKIQGMETTVTKQGEELAAVTKDRDELTKKLEEIEKAFPPAKKPAGEPDMDDAAKKALEVSKAKDEAVQKEMADLRKQAEEATAIAKAEREARIDMEFAKKAETEYPNVPGEPAMKGKLLKAIDAFDDDLKKFATETLKASNDAITKAFTEVGALSLEKAAGSPEAELNKMATEYQKANTGMTFEKAYDAVAQTPAGAALYQKAELAKQK